MRSRALIFLLMALLVGCTKESEKSVRHRLDLLVAQDMKDIEKGLDAAILLDSSYIKMLDWRSYDDGKYSHRAFVEFYFFKSLPKKIIRKYRYVRSAKKWERYYNAYHSINGIIPIPASAEDVDSLKTIKL